MSFEIRTTPKFERLFKKLPRDVQERVVKRILNLAEEPYQGKPLRGKLKGKFSLVVGDYRVVYEVRDQFSAWY